ncbi:hypothetical protein [Flavobacterium sp.]|nr:hypothetical protein [Flavobacterium sp.]HLF51504.1 hypothetical protein [Flavobacterium sp.]
MKFKEADESDVWEDSDDPNDIPFDDNWNDESEILPDENHPVV